MVKPNTETWQWETNFTPQKEGTVFGEARQVTFRAEDDIKYLDTVALYGSGSTWNFSAGQTFTQRPSVVTCGTNGTDGFKCIGVAITSASSGEAVTVQLQGVVVCKTNTAITCGDTVHGSLAKTNEKFGTVHSNTLVTGDPILGIALNTTETPATVGTGTAANPFRYRPVAVWLKQWLNPDNK